MLQDAVDQCSVIAVIADRYDESGGCDAMTHDDTKEAKLPNKNSDDNSDDAPSAAAAPTSFSLFDMLDAQKGGFNLPPRVMAYQIIEAYEHEEKQRRGDGSTNNTQTTQIDDKSTTATTLLELFEKATDIEDLSIPDLNSWEEVRKILYRGLLISTSNDDDDTNAMRYVKVHQTLHDKCCHTNNNELSVQSWDLVYNLLGSLLHVHQQQQSSSSLDDVMTEETMNLYWDTTRTLLNILSNMAMNYVTSSVGNEYEIERLLLGLCVLLANNDDVACILSMMDPMCGYFEVWSRFVMDRKKFMTIVQLSGLGSVVLQRCQDALLDATNTPMRGMRSRRVWNTIVQSATNNEESSDGGGGKPTTGDDIRYCTCMQSLTILRTIMFRCSGSSSAEVMASLTLLLRDHRHDTTTIKPSSFLITDGVISTEAVQTLLSKTTATADNENKCLAQQQQQHSNDDDNRYSDDTKAVLKSFCNDLLKKMKDDSTRISNDNINNHDPNLLCAQIVQLVERMIAEEDAHTTTTYQRQ